MIQIIFYSYIVCGVIAALILIQDELDSFFDSIFDCLTRITLFFIFIIFWPGFIYMVKTKAFSRAHA